MNNQDEKKNPHWIIEDHTEYGIEAKCSQCGYQVYTLSHKLPNYCGNCGEKMNQISKI